MKVTDFTKSSLHYRRTIASWKKEGFIQVGENGGPLWRFHRGDWIGEKITDVRIAPNGIDLWIKTTGVL